MGISEATTQGVQVRVESSFDPARSDPDEGRWFFLYSVTITNVGDTSVRLISRHWIITDGDGRVEEVNGPGVVGEQPILDPGQSFEYTSGCPLPTAYGFMRGTYQMMAAGGDTFDAEIADFELSEPYVVN